MGPKEIQTLLQDRLQIIEERLTVACQRVGRMRAEVTLVAVTKTVSPEVAKILPGLGLVHLGENRPQELWKKVPLLPANVHWHMIGHLQRNKIEQTLPLVQLIHSVDSIRLLDALEKEAVRQNRNVPVLLEVNASGEQTKQGFAPEELPRLVGSLEPLQKVQVQGLMTMAPFQEPKACRPCFVRLRQWRDQMQELCQPPHSFEHLSMGMSNDFEVAVEEGATLVRLGTVLFEGLEVDQP